MAKRETSETQAAFEAFYANGRSIPRVAEQFKISDRTARNWAEWFGWHARADARDVEAAKRAERIAVERRAKVLEEQRKAGELLRRRGVEFFVENKVEDGRTAISAVSKGVELERMAEEFVAARVEVTGKDGGAIIVEETGSARRELAQALTALVDAFTAGSADRAALAEDGDDSSL